MKQSNHLNEPVFLTNMHDIYSPMAEIKKEIQDRWNNIELRKDVENFLGEYLLENLKDKPKAVFCRNIFTPNVEFNYFIDVSHETHLEPLLLEYHSKFVAKNQEKYHLCKLSFFKEGDKSFHERHFGERIVNFNEWEGKNVIDIKTIWGESLVDFHHRILFEKFSSFNKSIVDITQWFNTTRKITPHYYLYFLTLFVCHGVLFENFLFDDEQELKFTTEKVLPSLEEVRKRFGLKPLIFPLLPIEHAKQINWLSYPALLKNSIKSYNK